MRWHHVFVSWEGEGGAIFSMTAFESLPIRFENVAQPIQPYNDVMHTLMTSYADKNDQRKTLPWNAFSSYFQLIRPVRPSLVYCIQRGFFCRPSWTPLCLRRLGSNHGLLRCLQSQPDNIISRRDIIQFGFYTCGHTAGHKYKILGIFVLFLNVTVRKWRGPSCF